MEQNVRHVKPTILVVDDEINILRAIRRTLHKLDVELLLAETPEKALNIIDERTIDVIVSDMKMPNINGAQLLTKMKEKQPNSFRVILSGYADIELMLSAINQGEVHRYLTKPWSNKALLDVINSGIELTKLRRENLRLLALTKKQNKKLAQNNQELETKVALRTRQIKATLTRIQQHSLGMERALYNVLVSHPSIDGKFARQVSESALQLAKKLALSEKEQTVVKLAALVCQIGLVSVAAEIIEMPYYAMNDEQRKAYKNQTYSAVTMLSPLQALQEEIAFITCQFDPVNKKPEPPKGAQIISICRDYWRYRTGRMLNSRLSHNGAAREMNKYIGIQYDKLALKAFLSIDKDVLDTINKTVINSDNLIPGMVLKNDWYNDKHILLLPIGHIFTITSIAKVQNFELGKRKRFTFEVDDAASNNAPSIYHYGSKIKGG